MHPLDRLVFAALTVFLSTTVANAQLVTDRPDFTESTEAIAPGTWQVESGLTWTDDGAVDGFNLPEALIRTGLSQRWELRIGLPEYADFDAVSGMTDASLGLKVELGSVGSGEMALIAEVSLPIGDDELTSDSVDPTVILVYGRGLGRGWSLGSQVGLSSLSLGNEDLIVVAPTLVVASEFRPDWGVFYELAAEIPDQGRSSVLFHTGITWGHRPRGQWDLHVASGLTSGAPDSQIGVGYSWMVGGR